MFLLVHSYLSKVAQSDIEEIFQQKITKAGTWQAWTEMESMRERIDDLSCHPDSGECRDEIWQGILSVLHHEHVIYFRRCSSALGVEILSVGALQDDPKFTDESDRKLC